MPLTGDSKPYIPFLSLFGRQGCLLSNCFLKGFLEHISLKRAMGAHTVVLLPCSLGDLEVSSQHQ
jgi:hypothetical protein